jgi:hypothetical protein
MYAAHCASSKIPQIADVTTTLNHKLVLLSPIPILWKGRKEKKCDFRMKKKVAKKGK